MFKLKVLLLQLSKQVWPKVSIFAAVAVASALMALFLKNYIPEDWAYKIGADSVGAILTIIASSMLAVTTFSLTIMISAYAAATNNVTPRATQLLTQDSTTQNALATFLGSFLFSLVGIILLRADVYESNGRVVLFFVTILVILAILVMLIRWIDHLTKLGRVTNTTRMVEEAALKSMKKRAEEPLLGGRELVGYESGREGMKDIPAGEFGYVQYIDMEKLSEVGGEKGCIFHIAALPGKFVAPHTPLLRTNLDLDEETLKKISGCFIIAEERTFEEDPRYGLCVLSEVASKALSAAYNDSGTVIDVLGRLVKVLDVFARAEPVDPRYNSIYVPPLMPADLFMDAFHAVARDGAGIFEVQCKLHKCLAALRHTGNPEFTKEAEKWLQFVLEHSDGSKMLNREKRYLHDWVRNNP